MHPWDAQQLDEVEGVNSGTYQKLTVRIATLDGDVTAWVYVFAGYEGGLPTSWYLSEIATAAERAGAPEDYVKDLRARPTRSATAVSPARCFGAPCGNSAVGVCARSVAASASLTNSPRSATENPANASPASRSVSASA